METSPRTTLDVVARALFGADVADEAGVIANALGRFMDRFHASLTGWVPIPLSMPAPGNLRARHAIRRIDATAPRYSRPRSRPENKEHMNVYLLDGTYELFRYFAAVPSRRDREGREIGAVRGVVTSVRKLIVEGGATHLGVATDHVVESFRNDLWPDYKTSEGVEPELLAQFPVLEQALQALGVMVWPMVRFEADDALAAAAAAAAADPRVERILIGTPDKDLAQCVRGDRVVLLDRRRERILDERGVREKFGVAPESIPDWLALVGDQADGFPGVPGFGARTAALLLARYPHLESIPGDPAQWDVKVRGAARLASTLREHWDRALLFRELATLRTDAVSLESVDALAWQGPRSEFGRWAERLQLTGLADMPQR